jgi:protein phosphatase
LSELPPGHLEALAAARDPRCPPATIRALVPIDDRQINAALAANPNTPIDVLIKLAASCPGELLANPALEVLELEEPGALSRLSFHAVLRLIEHPEVPGWLASRLLENKGIGPGHRARLASSSASPGLLAVLCSEDGSGLQDDLARNPALPEECARALLDDSRPETRRSLARHARHPSILARLADDPHPLTRLLARTRQRPPSDGAPLALQAHGQLGLGQRERQADALALTPLPGAFLALVTHGMGGHGTDAVAAEIIARELPRTIAGLVAGPPTGEEAACLGAAFTCTHEDLGWYARHHGISGYSAVLAALLICGDQAHIAHVGDSLVYRLRRGTIEALTEAHTLLHDIRKGTRTLPADLKNVSLYNVISRSLGGHNEAATPEQRTVIIEPGDIFLLGTAGLHGALAPEEMATILTEHPGDTEGAARALIKAAEAAGSQNNRAAVVVLPGKLANQETA